MSSLLRSTQTPTGYFVMSGDTILDGSGHGLYEAVADAVYANSGVLQTRPTFKFNALLKDTLFTGDATNAASVTLQDLGKTEYGGQLFESDGSTEQGVSDMRKVKILTNGFADADAVYYVPLGTDLRNTTGENLVSTTIKPSVALVGKLL